MTSESSTTYLLTRFTLHVGLHNYNGRQMELFHIEWFVDRLIRPRLCLC